MAKNNMDQDIVSIQFYCSALLNSPHSEFIRIGQRRFNKEK